MERVIELLDAIPYLRAYAGQTFVVKAGGELMLEPTWLDGVARDLGVLHRLGIETERERSDVVGDDAHRRDDTHPQPRPPPA